MKNIKIKGAVASLIFAMGSMTSSAVNYRGFVEGEMMVNSSIDNVSSVSEGLSTSHGLQINEHLFTGVGAGIYFFSCVKYENDLKKSKVKMPVSLFLNARYEFMNIRKKGRPFIDLKAGFFPVAGSTLGNFGSATVKYYKMEEDENGDFVQKVSKNEFVRNKLAPLFLNLSLGYRYRIHENLGVYAALNFMPLFIKTEISSFSGAEMTQTPTSSTKENKVKFGCGLSIGIDF